LSPIPLSFLFTQDPFLSFQKVSTTPGKGMIGVFLKSTPLPPLPQPRYFLPAIYQLPYNSKVTSLIVKIYLRRLLWCM